MTQADRGRSVEQVERDLKHIDIEQAKKQYVDARTTGDDTMTKMMKVKSNSIRNNVAGPYGPSGASLFMHFNEEGIANVPEHQRPILAQVQRVRPGRFTILDDAPAAPVVKAEPVEESKPPVKEIVLTVVTPEVKELLTAAHPKPVPKKAPKRKQKKKPSKKKPSKN